MNVLNLLMFNIKKVTLSILICITFSLTLFCGCATKGTTVELRQEPASTKTEAKNPHAHASLYLTDKIKVIKQGQSYRVKITTNSAPTYTAFKLTNPERIIIDIPEAVLESFGETEVMQNEFIKGIKASQLYEHGKPFSRIQIYLKQNISFDVKQKDNNIFVDIASVSKKTDTAENTQSKNRMPAESLAGKNDESHEDKPPVNKNAIANIEILKKDNGYAVSLTTDTVISKYSSQTLQNPNRLVVDFPHCKIKLSNRVFTVDDALIDKVRIGERHDSSRVVLDFLGKIFPFYQIAQKANNLTINVMPASYEASSVNKHKDTVAPPKSADITTNSENRQVAENIKSETGVKKYTGQKISLDFKDADIKNVLRLIADISGLNIIASDSVQGRVTLKLENIPWDEALDLILETNNLGKITTRNIVRIETMDKIKRINAEKLEAKKSQEKLEDLVIETVDVSYVKARDLVGFIKKLRGVLSERGSINYFEDTNKITIQDIKENVARIKKMIIEQDIPTRQVLIDAKIVQSNPSYSKELGVKWGGLYNTTKDGGATAGSGGADISISGAAGEDGSVVNLPAPVGLGSGGGINFGYLTDTISLDMQLTALENEEKIKIISSPRILGLDNVEARIKQGVALPYLKLSEEGVTSTEFKDAVLELKVTPHITPANTIKLHIFVTKNQRSSQTGAGGEPGIDVREVETDLLVESGKTIVIGGIYENTKLHRISKVPFFADIPYIGRFFKNERQEDQLIELLVFLTVTVVKKPELPVIADKKPAEILG